MHTADTKHEHSPLLRLADRGTTACVITLASPTAPERAAAEELAAHLCEITGAAFPVVDQAQAGDRPQLAVGYGAARGVGVSVSAFRDLGEEGIFLRTVGPHLALTGAEVAPRGTLYAVAVFLEDVLGCRWWTPDVADIPRRETLDIPPIALWYRPIFEYRHQCYAGAQDIRWSVRNRFNAGPIIPTELGGGHVFEPFVHTFYRFVPPKEHFAAHPAWFSEVGGKRVGEGAQLCLTNSELTAFVVEHLRQYLRSRPEVTIVSLSQNDWGGNCACAACQAIDREEGSPAGSLLHFVNTVAAALEEEFPHVAVETLAYAYTRKAPAHARPRGNVIVRLCSFECDFLHPWTHPNNQRFREDLEAWARICDRLYIWDYVTNFAHYVQPFPNWFTLGAHIRYFSEHHVKGLFSEGNYSSVGGEMSELRAWVLAKLHWNPALDTAALIDEFLRGYYGRAAAHLAHYLQTFHAAAEAITRYDGSPALQRAAKEKGFYPTTPAGCYLDLNSPSDAPFLAPDVVLEALRHLASAEAAVAGDAALRERVLAATLPAWYAALLRWHEIRAYAQATGQAWPLPEDRATACAAFVAICARQGITHLAESWAKRDCAWLTALCASGKDVETNDG